MPLTQKALAGWLRRGFVSGLSFMQWDEKDRLHRDYTTIADSMRRFMKVDDIHALYLYTVLPGFLR